MTGTGAEAKEEASDREAEKDKTPKTKETVGDKRANEGTARRSLRIKGE